MLAISMGEIFNIKKITVDEKTKNIMTFIFVFSGFLATLAILFAQSLNSNYQENKLLVISILSDWRIYLAISLEIIGVLISRKNYQVNGAQITAISLSIFSSILIVPIIAFFLTDFFGFKQTINLNYQSNMEFIIFIGLVAVCMFLFFMDKFKGGSIHNKTIFLLMPLSLSLSMFFTSKIMQLYSGVFTYALIGFSLSMFFLISSFMKRELISDINIKLASKISIISFIIIPMNIFLIKMLAVEIVTILKRVCQLIGGTIFDYKNNGRIIFSIKDRVVLSIIIFVSFILMYFRGYQN